MPIDATILEGDHGALLATLTDPQVINAWCVQAGEEPADLADAALLRHLALLQRAARTALTAGFAVLAEREPDTADALLTDILAVALWHGWPLPVTVTGPVPVQVAGLPRGLLGRDPGGEGAGVWVLGDGRIAFSRCREAGEQADMQPHWRLTGHGP